MRTQADPSPFTRMIHFTKMMHSLLILSFLSINLMACKVGPDFESPDPPCVDRFTKKPLPKKTASARLKRSGGKAQYFALNRDMPAEWWALFKSKALNDLVERGIANSPDLDAAQAALRVAEENYLAGLGALFPAVGLQASAQRQRFSNQSIGVERVPSSVFSLYNVSVNVSYVLDVFGGIRRNIESLCALVDYQHFILEGTYIALTANIVTTAITEASLRAQIQATRDLVRLQEDILKIVRGQFALGGVSSADILAQEAQLAQTRATLPPLEKALGQARNALSVLVGELPSEAELPNFYLQRLKLPRVIPVSVPSQLVAQRPDIRAAEALLHQASALIGVATANMLPQITLNANYGYESQKLKDLFSPSNVVWMYGATLTQPIFQGGTLVARRRASIATYEQMCAQYRNTVLQAFQNVADSLTALENDARTLRAQTEAENAAFKALALTKQQYKLGAVNYLLLLNAERTYREAHLARIRAEALRYSDTVALFQSLGGGWWHRPAICEPLRCNTGSVACKN